jgi:signal transduction histidine kinase
LRYATERKRLERLKDEFVSTVSHELRTPLTSIAGSLGLLMARAGDEMSEPVVRLLRIAHSNCERLVRLVNDILDIEKLEAGRVCFDMKKVEPSRSDSKCGSCWISPGIFGASVREFHSPIR